MPTPCELPADTAINAPTDDHYIRVQAERLDAVINLLGELVIAGAGATLLAQASREVGLMEANQSMNRLIEEIRNGTLGLRRVPLRDTFNRMRGVVHDTAASSGKAVNFEIVGGEAELDKSMVDKIADPLMHLVRHVLEHGLESTQERLAAGKPAAGQLTLRAHHETGAILIRLEDDGRGRDLTAPGVGLNVARQSIEALRGSLQFSHQPGRGAHVEIRLPLTLAIMDGFLVGVGRSKFVLPLDAVVEVIEAGDQHVKVDDNGQHCLTLRGAVLPVVRLRTLYAVPSSHTDRVSVVVVNASHGQYGIEVDVLLGQQQTVIKPLGRLFKTLRGLSGSSILGSGDVALILDVNSLGALVTSPVRSLQAH